MEFLEVLIVDALIPLLGGAALVFCAGCLGEVATTRHMNAKFRDEMFWANGGWPAPPPPDDWEPGRALPLEDEKPS